MDKDASAEALGWTLCAVLGLSYGLVAGVAGCRGPQSAGQGARRAVDDAEGPPLVGDALRGGAVCLLRARVDAVGLGGGDRVDVRDAGPGLAFYVLDQLPTTVLFTIYGVRGVILGEMVFVATDGALLYEDYARPADAVVNAATYALLVLQWAALADRSYACVPGPYALVSAALYAFAAALLVGFGRAAAYELRRVPIEGVLRRKKLREIGALTSAGAFATLGRSVALLAVRDRALPLEGPWDARCRRVFWVARARARAPRAVLLPPDPAAAGRTSTRRSSRSRAPAATRGTRSGAWPSSSSEQGEPAEGVYGTACV